MNNRFNLSDLMKNKPHLIKLNPDLLGAFESLSKSKGPLFIPVEDKTLPSVKVEVKKFYSIEFIVWGEPCSKPRMTQQDRWKKRKCTARYWDWKAKAVSSIPKGSPFEQARELHFKVYIGLKKSYGKRKKRELAGCPHLMRGDVDNYAKAILDALFDEDKNIWKISGEKRWEDEKGPRVEIILKQ